MSAVAKSGIQSHITVNFPIKSPGDAKALAEELPPLMPDFTRRSAQDAGRVRALFPFPALER